MRKFEYKVITTHRRENCDEVEKTLQRECKDGWELVNAQEEKYPSHDPSGEEVIMVFKKEIE
jgi:hypothetical protein